MTGPRHFFCFALLAVSSLAYYIPDDEHRNLAASYAPPASVSQTKDCPPGYSLNGKHCEAINIQPSSFVCPPGTSNISGQCVTFAPVSKVCPPGSQLTGDTCRSTQVSPASLVCAQGELDDSGRSCQSFHEVPPVCPAGHRMEGSGSCVRHTPSRLVCPPGFALKGKGSCVQAVSAPASPVCEPDMTFDGRKTCTKHIQAPTRCPSGYHMAGKQCIRSVNMQAAPCPQGFHLSGRQCVRQLESPATPVCPAEYTLQGKTCTQQVHVPPTCPAGTRQSVSGGCERPVAQVPVCEDGMKLSSSGGKGGPQCHKTFQMEPTPTCPAGFSLIHGKCKKVITYPSALRCHQGVLQGNACTVQTSQNAAYECPPEYRFAKGNKCVKDIEYDCSSTVKSQQCEFPSYVAEILSASGGKHRVLKGVPHHTTSSGKEPICQDVPRVVPKTCRKTESVSPMHICPDGSRPAGKNCPVINVFEADVYCPRGLLDQASGQCLEVKMQPAQEVCPPGTHRQGSHCVQHHVQPAALVCPDNSESGKDGQCVVRVQEIHHAPRVLQQAPQMICQQGHLVNKKCIDSEMIPQEFVCPAGTHNADGKCITAADPIVPTPVLVSKPAAYQCLDGGRLSGKSCLSSLSVPAERVCTDGGDLQGDRCIHQLAAIQSAPRVVRTPATPVCPPGLTLQGNRCVEQIHEPASLTCPAGHDLDGSGMKCLKPHPMSEVCPIGTHKGPEGCVSKSRVPPTVTIVKQCTKGQHGC